MQAKIRGFSNHLRQATILFFPEYRIFRRDLPVARLLGLFIIFFSVYYFLGFIIPANGFFAFDWVNFWGEGDIPPYYPPWTALVIKFLSWQGLTGITLAALAVAIILRAVHPVSGFLAFLSLPVFWTVFLGQLDGVVLLGLLGLPWLAPLALIKPQVSLFAFGAKKTYLFALMGILLLSLIIWGPWPLNTLNVNTYYAEGRYEQDISLGLWGIFITLPLMWFSRGDIDMLMLSGAFIAPRLIFYNLLPVVPAISRLKPASAAVITFLSWLPLTANWLGSAGWWLGWISVGWLWMYLFFERYPERKQVLQRRLNVYLHRYFNSLRLRGSSVRSE